MSHGKPNDYVLLINDSLSDNENETKTWPSEDSGYHKASLHRRIIKSSEHELNKGRRSDHRKACNLYDGENTSRRVHKMSESDLGLSLQNNETEETVKCVISSALFVAVVVTLVLVAVLKNPEM